MFPMSQMFPFKGINCKSQCHESKDFFDSHIDRVFTWKTIRSDFPKPNVLLIAMISGVKFESYQVSSIKRILLLAFYYVSHLRKLALHNSYQRANPCDCCAITSILMQIKHSKTNQNNSLTSRSKVLSPY